MYPPTVYANAIFSGFCEFQPFSAIFTFCARGSYIDDSADRYAEHVNACSSLVPNTLRSAGVEMLLC